MALSNDLISQFVKITKDDNKTKNEVTRYATVKITDGRTYVQFDGADIITPISTTASVKDGDRVTVQIKNHEAYITGNLSSPSANSDYVNNALRESENKLSGALTEQKQELLAELASGIEATVEGKLSLHVDQLKAELIEADKAIIGQLQAEIIEADNAIIANLEATNARVYNLESVYGNFEDLVADRLTSDFANINIANIDKAAIGQLFAEMGLITTAVIENGHVTGYLESVYINANDIKAGTLSVDRLVINGNNESLIFALNNAGDLTSTSVDTLDGGLLTERTITADKLVAHSITANEITASDIIGAYGWINLAEGTFNYGNQLIWDGETLHISAEAIKVSALDNIRVGARNLIRNSNTLMFEEYYFDYREITITYEDENVIIDYPMLTVEDDGGGNVTFNGINAEYDNGNVILKK